MEKRQQTGLHLSQAASTPDLSLPRVESSFLLMGTSPATHALQSLVMFNLLLLTPPPLYPLESSQNQFCPDSPWCVSAHHPTPPCFVFYFLSKPALAAFPSLASSTHFINMLFTSACRSLATILNNWQFA